jgi:hypothetical protein
LQVLHNGLLQQAPGMFSFLHDSGKSEWQGLELLCHRSFAISLELYPDRCAIVTHAGSKKVILFLFLFEHNAAILPGNGLIEWGIRLQY